MLTDSDLIRLHNDKDYVAQKSVLKNLKYTMKIVKVDSLSGIAQMNIGFGGELSVKGDLVRLCWSLCKYYFITKELVDYRTKIIEGLLSESYRCGIENLVKDSIGVEYRWLEYEPEKLEIMKRICLSHLSVVENRVMYVNACKDMGSNIENELLGITEKIRKIFDDEIIKINKSRIKNLESMLPDEESRNKAIKAFEQNSKYGILTGPINKENYNGN